MDFIKNMDKEKSRKFSTLNINFYSIRVKKYFLILTLVIGMTMFFSCFNNGIEKPAKTDPVIENVSLDYSQLAKSLFISAKVIDPQGWEDIDSVSFYLYRKDSLSAATETLFLYGNLSDDGPPRDIIERDNVYSYLVDSSMIADNEGFYRVTVQAFDSAGNTSDIISETEEVKQNSPPVIYLLEAPDSFEKGDTLIFRVRATDPQGISDIRSITYTIKLPDGEIKPDYWFLRDDGKFGDKDSLDGIYTVHQSTNPESKLQGLFIFYFVAKDYCGALSDTITVPVTNPGVTIIHPNESDTLHSGNKLTIEWESAYISKLKLEYTTNSNSSPPSFESIADNVSASKGSYDWIIPYVGSYDFCKIRVSDNQQSSRYDLSDNPFSIKP